MRYVIAAVVLIGLGVAGLAVWPSLTEDKTCHARIRPGPNSNTSRLDTTLDIPRDEWPAVLQVFRAFAVKHHWSLRDGIGTSDPNYRWFDMCDDAVTTIRGGNTDGEGQRIGFGIVHMTYRGPDKDGWRVFYRELHRQLEARWPGRMSYIEGEFGKTIARPDWLGPVARPDAAGDPPRKGE